MSHYGLDRFLELAPDLPQHPVVDPRLSKLCALQTQCICEALASQFQHFHACGGGPRVDPGEDEEAGLVHNLGGKGLDSIAEKSKLQHEDKVSQS